MGKGSVESDLSSQKLWAPSSKTAMTSSAYSILATDKSRPGAAGGDSGLDLWRDEDEIKVKAADVSIALDWIGLVWIELD